jgi:hypothetical protein
MQVEKVYQVVVKVYHKQEVPKFTKYFDTEAKAIEYKSEISDKVWNTPVVIEIVEKYIVDDGFSKFVLNGTFVNVE